MSPFAYPNSRRRLISFRLSDQEYEGLQQLCAAQGARSLSDFVRSGVCMMLQTREPWEEEVACTMREFGRRAVELHKLIEQLTHLLRRAHRNPPKT
jgi:Arc/MetJ-type ribon-helix-helix transcriptional regulator